MLTNEYTDRTDGSDFHAVQRFIPATGTYLPHLHNGQAASSAFEKSDLVVDSSLHRCHDQENPNHPHEFANRMIWYVSFSLSPFSCMQKNMS